MPIEQQNQAAVNEPVAKSKGRKPIPENETAYERTKRLANMRVPKAVKSLMLVENLFIGPQYKFSPDDAQAVVAALSNVTCRIQERAENGGKSVDTEKFHI